jgi:starch-binding outer membrane protein, SusD/RagB family
MMTSHLSKHQFVITGLLLCVLSLGMFSCSKLEDKAIDTISDVSTLSPEQLLASAYGYVYVYPNHRNAFALNEHSTDELQLSTDIDFGDDGAQIHTHTWGAYHSQVVTSWDDYNRGHALANEVLANKNSSLSVKAQARFLRAFFMYQIMDLFGQVPFKDDKDITIVLSRAQAFDKIVAELEAVIPSLADAGVTPSQKIVATKEAAQAFLAKLYLNKGVYSAASVSATYTFAPADMDKVISYCDVLINSNKFALANKYFDNFAIDNDVKSKELVFNLPYAAGVNPIPSNYGSNQRLVYMNTHANQNPSGWNGFTTLSDFYNSFEVGDKRLGGHIIDSTQSGITYGFLVGQQYGKAGEKLKNRQGDLLIFTPDCPLYRGYYEENKGIRIMKFQPDFANPIAGANDFGFIRYADVLLMKAEALWRKGNATGAALLVNQVRKARGLADLATLTETNLLAERGHELYYEGWRRNDLIRFGKFNNPVINRATASPLTRRLFPIPQKEIDINPLLKQNEGY